MRAEDERPFLRYRRVAVVHVLPGVPGVQLDRRQHVFHQGQQRKSVDRRRRVSIRVVVVSVAVFGNDGFNVFVCVRAAANSDCGWTVI